MRRLLSLAVVALGHVGCGGSADSCDTLRCSLGGHEITVTVPRSLAMTRDQGSSSEGEVAAVEQHVVFRDKSRAIAVSMLFRKFDEKSALRAPRSAQLQSMKDGFEASKGMGLDLVDAAIKSINGLECVVVDFRSHVPGATGRTVSATTDLDNGALRLECTCPVAIEESFAAIAQEIIASLKVAERR